MATPAAPLNATTNAIAKGTVVFVQGEAYVRDASGKLSVIKPGDIVVEGQEIITKAGAIVEFELPTGVKVSVGPDRQLLLNDELFATTAPERSENVISSLGGTDAEKVIQALNDGKDPFADLDDTAAGLAGGGIGDQTHDFVRLVRVLENVTPVSYNYTSSTDGIDFLPAGSTTLPVNTPPTATADTNLQGTEDQPLNVDVLANDSDPENDPLVVVSASALNGQVTVNPDGSLRYVPKADFNGTDTVTYTISDGKGGTSTATATINVAAVNDAPVAIADTSSTPEDTPVTFTVLGNDSDPDGDPLTVSSASVDPTKGTVTINPDGTLTFTPAPNVNGPVTVTYTISDGNGGTATTTAIITVTPLADTAILGTGTGTVKEDTPAQTSASGTLSIVDPDAGQAAFQPQTNVPGTYGSFGVDAAGNWTYTLDNSRPVVQALAEGSVRAETFTVTSIDGTETTVTVNVIGTNDGPVATPDTATTNEDEPVTFAVLGNDTDPDGNTLTVTGASVDPSKGSVIVNANGTLTFTPAPNVNGPVTVTYTISDGNGGTATTTAIINVTPLADTAILGTGTGTVKEDTPTQTSASGTLSIVDPDAGQAAFQPQTNVPGTYGSFGVDAAGNWTYTLDNSRPVVQALAEGEAKVETFTVTSIDGTETTVTVNVIGTNDGPVATPDTATTNEDEPVTFAVLGNDTDPDSGDVLTVTGASVDPTKGSVVVNANGTLTFTPATNVNGPVTVTYTISDGHGGTSSTTAIINVTPVADTAIISSDTGITREDTTLLASGTLTITDGDAGEAAFQVQAGVPGTFGSFSIDTSGHWSYTLDNGNPLVQGLADGDTRSESFTVKSIDGTESTVVVTILGQNEIIGAPGVGIVKEDNPITTGGTLTASGGATFVPQPTTPGTYGNLSLNPDGNWTYTLNNPASVVQSLGEGQTRTETFPVSLSDGTTSTITITVVGTNDPAIVTPGSGSVTEDSILSTGGTLTVTDPDAGEAGFRPQTNVVGTYGSFTLDAAGNWTYTLNNANLDVQNLGLGDTLSENFPVQSTDGTPSSVAITIIGTNDGPVATPDTATTNEDEPVTFAVLGNDTDPDGNTLTVTGASVDPAQGSVIVNANGTLTFTPAPNVNGPVTVTYTIADGHGGTSSTTAIITVTPLADTAILGTGAGIVKEDTPAQTSASGTLSIVDPDAGQAAFQPQTNVPGTYGSFGVDAAGNWTYTLDNSRPVVQALAEGSVRAETFTVTSIDGTETTVTVNVIGTNDGPVATPDTATTNEDEPVTFAVLGNDTDPDGNTLTVTGASVDPAQGSVVVNANGTLTFTPAPNVNGPVTVTYTIADGHGGTATTTAIINVAPTNDAPTSGPSAATTVEDTAYVLHAADFPFADGDAGDSFGAVRITSLPTNGSLTLDGVTITGPVTVSTADLAAGKLKFVPDANENGLNYATFDYQVVDQNGGSAPAQTFTVNVTPLADTAILGTGAGIVKEDTPAQTSASGTLSIVDPDAGQAAFQPQTNVPGTYGSFGVDAAGNWTYTLDNSRPVVQALAEGSVRAETFTVTSIDGTETTVTVNVIGTNDGPVATPDTATTNEDEPVTFAVLGNDTDPDGNTLTVTGASVDPSKGSVIVNANGTLTFTPAPNVNGPVTVTYTISDGNGGTATTTAIINVTPLADTAILGTGTGTVKEDTPAQTSASGTLSIVDPDAGQAAFQPQTNVPGTYGSFGVDAAGNWTYTLDNSRPVVQALAEGSVRAETFTVTSIDGTETTVTVNVIGTNDGPVATPDTATTNEDEPVTFAVLGNDTDPDGNTLTVTGASVDPTQGSVVVNANGTLTFTPAANINGPVTVTYTIADGHGGTSSTTAIINVAPLADTAILGTGTGTVKEDTPAQTGASGTLSIVDPDAGQAAFQPQTNVPGTYGSFGVDAAGNWTYTLDNSRPVVQALAEGSVRAETFTVTSIDGTETTVTVNVIGTNDGPVATPDTATTNEDEPVTFAVLDNDTDPDGNTLTVTGASVDPTQGSVIVNANGTLTFTPAANVNGPVTVTYTIADGHGGTATTTATITVTPLADTAILGTGTGTVKEDTPAQTSASGTLSIVDPDAGQAAFQPQTNVPGTYGSFGVDAAGNWIYTLDNSRPVVQALAEGSVRAETFTVTSIDGTETTVTVNVIGTNDGPVATPDTATTNEDEPVTFAVLGNDTDPDGNTLTVTGASVDPTQGSVVVNANGTLTFTPAANINGPVTVTYTIADGHGGTSSTTAIINVAPLADTAILGTGTGTVKEDTPAQTGASGTLSIVDPDAGQAAFQPQTNVPGTYGSFGVDAAGNWTYTLDNSRPVVQALAEGSVRAETFTVTSIDGTETTVTVNVIGTNDGPVATPDTATTNEDEPVTFAVLDNDTDPDGNTLTVTGASVDPTQGSVIVNANGTLTFTPAANVNGPVTVTYTIADGHGGTATTTATITVTPLADTAILGTGTGTVKEDTPAQTSASGTLSIVDPDAGQAAFQPQTNVPGTYGSFGVDAAGNWIYTLDNSRPVVQALAEGEAKVETFTVTSIDGTETTVTVNVIGTNTPPVATDNANTVPINGPASGNVLTDATPDSDPDGNPLSVASFTVAGRPETFAPGQTVTLTGVGTLVIAANGDYTFTPAPNYAGAIPVVTYTLSDGLGGTDTATLSLAMGSNTPPVATDNANTVPINGPASGNVLTDATPDSDPDGNPLSVASFTVAGRPETFAPGQTVTLTGVGTLVIAANGDYTFTPAPNYAGAIPVVTYTLSDGLGGTDTATLSLTMGSNTPPVATDNANTVPINGPASGNVLTDATPDSDPDGNPLSVASFTVAGRPETFAPGQTVTLTGVGTLVIAANGDYTFTPAPNYAGAIPVVTYTLSDGLGGTDTATLSLAMGSNTPPVATDNANTVPINGPASGNVLTDATPDSDPDGNPLSVASFTVAGRPETFAPGQTVTLTGVGTLVIAANGDYTFTPAPNYAGAIPVVTYTLSDGLGGTDTATLSLTMGSNTPPVATDNANTVPINGPASGNVLTDATPDSDPDGNPLSVASFTVAGRPETFAPGQTVTLTGVGTLVIAANGDYTFTPAPNYAGAIPVVTYTLSDGLGGTDTATLSLTMGSNTPPVALADTGSTDQNTALTHNAPTGVISNDSDVDGNTLQVTHIAAGSTTADVTSGGTAIGGNFGNLLINPDGSYTYTPDAAAKALTQGQSATDVFTYTIADGNGGTATTTLSIDVTGKNDAPITGGVATGNVTEDGVTTASGALTISDADAGQSSFVPQTITGTYGTLTLQAGGSWSYSLNNADASVQGLKQDQQVVDHINVTTADGTLKEVAITITGTNDIPVVGNATVNVSEEGLTGSIADTSGTLDTTNLTTTSGTIGVSDTDGNTLVATLTAPTTSLSSGGVEITWSGSGTHTLVGSAGTTEIVRATIADNGNYTVKLSGPLDHPVTTSEDTLSLALGIKVSDGITTTTSTLTVIVEDDAPIASNVSQNIAVATVDTNLLIILDNSGSMNTSDGVDGTTRLKSAVEALKQLINRYDDFGEVRVRIVTFNSKASALGTTWTDVDIAKDQLTLVTPTGTTNYDSAITAGQSAFASTGKLASGQNLVYFLSDGQPNPGTEIGTADETAWKSFLQSNNVTSYALGMGTGAAQSPLDPIAYDGVTQTNLNGQVITDFNNLSSALQTTIPQPASGELLSGGLFGSTTGFGADGGNIRAITVDGVTYNYDATANGSVTVTGGASHGTYSTTTHQLTITTAAGGTLVVNMNTGSYTYTPIATVSTALKDGFSFVLVDKDGDLAGADVAFDISRAASSVINLSSTTTVIDSSKLGLTGEYYGYNETTSATNTSTHADDTTLGNLDHVSDMVSIIDGRSGETLVGTYDAAPASSADATFSADKIDYGFGYTTGTTTVGAVNGNLGANPTLGADLAVNSGALYNFLRGGTVGSDASTLSTTSGLGNTTDSGIRLVGLINLNGGTYDIRVTADDGFRLNIGDQTVAMFDNIQSPTARTYTGVSLAAGLQPIEVLYWEQGGNARLRIEVKLSSEPDTSYKTLGTDDFALFSPTSAPVLGDLQDITEDSTQNGQWLVRTGQEQTGTSGNDQITGSDGQDIITGGAGNDTLTGGLGSDTFKWTLGDAGTTTKPALDAITDFNKASESLGGDVLDLRDLLQGESHTGTAVGNLGSYLHFEKSGSDTVVHVSTNGGYTGGTFTAVATDQKVVLQGVDLTNGGALATDSQIIQDLLTKGKLSAD